MICTVEELYEKRKKIEIESAKLYARAWKNTFGVYPTVCEMTNAYAWLYLPHTQETLEKYPDLFELSGVEKDIYVEKFLNSQPTFDSFEDFLEGCK